METHPSKGPGDPAIPEPVVGDLPFPEVTAIRRHPPSAMWAPVPKAPIHEDRQPFGGKVEVGFPGNPRWVTFPAGDAPIEKLTGHDHLRGLVPFSLDLRHKG